METTIWDYILPTILCLTPTFICALIPLIITALVVADIGRKRLWFTLPSRNTVIKYLQIALFTLLAALILAHFEAKWNIFGKCFDEYSVCEAGHRSHDKYLEAIGLPLIPDTGAEREAIIRHLLPPRLRDRCYLGHEKSCQEADWLMVNQFYPPKEFWFPYPNIWLLALVQSLVAMAYVRRKFPDQRKTKQKHSD